MLSGMLLFLLRLLLLCLWLLHKTWLPFVFLYINWLVIFLIFPFFLFLFLDYLSLSLWLLSILRVSFVVSSFHVNHNLRFFRDICRNLSFLFWRVFLPDLFFLGLPIFEIWILDFLLHGSQNSFVLLLIFFCSFQLEFEGLYLFLFFFLSASPLLLLFVCDNIRVPFFVEECSQFLLNRTKSFLAIIYCLFCLFTLLIN